MKTMRFLPIIILIIFMQSCYKPADIQIQNNISQVKITDIKWGDHYLTSGLLPGEKSRKETIDRYMEKLPSSQRISFTMKANNKSVYLETEESYTLEEDDDVLIVLTDDTKVRNLNE